MKKIERAIAMVCLMLTLTACTAVLPERGASRASLAIKMEIQNKWDVVYLPENGAYVLQSPAYARVYGDGCVAYMQVFPTQNSTVNFSEIEFETRYFAAGPAVPCSQVPRERFFRIEGDEDVIGVLAVVRTVFDGVIPGRDIFEEKDLPRLQSCFSEDYKDEVRVLRAASYWEKDAIKQSYHLVLRCPALANEDEIVVVGREDDPEIVWRIVPSRPLDVN